MGDQTKKKHSIVEEVFESILFNSRFLVLLAVIGTLIAAVIMFLKGSIEIIQGISSFSNVMTQFSASAADDKSVILSFIPAIDNYLFAIFLLIFSMGIYELFISEIDPTWKGQFTRPNWLKIVELDDLTRRVAEVVIMILIVEFFKQAFTIKYDHVLDLLFLAVGIILIAISLFVTHKIIAKK